MCGEERLRVADEPRAYVTYRQMPDAENIRLILKSSMPRALAAGAAQAVHAIDPTIPVDDIATMDERVAESLSSDRTNMLLMGIFAALGLIQASVGIFSVVAYMVSRRSHEIAIRMALGAQPREAFRLVLNQGLIMTASGIGIGLVEASMVADARTA